ncbi:uncharacterized protein MICPUCDRAFT_62794 [Micromonas pusilla CCMP1545]|uniref:Predicted protein n=1 Tax=Micromonas pusilla (strain CCMP1545) TaxID=564608 RepID=C1N0D3_MICPC|nr:uncharacterized protein MICPUCDRAFT_62794 [Micromonas pusilla CCMP1545]EEH54006.1 predicted protein [Micromonas pusilla CCMP1545]|eukprot:XP_003061376.1 predicted protein [Micromonas pusilla CCMP1545]
MNPTDEYMTPPSAWEAIQKYIPKNKVIWEAFYGDGKSGDTLRTLGFKVIHDEVDFFENNLGDVIVSNPPFSRRAAGPRASVSISTIAEVYPSDRRRRDYSVCHEELGITPDFRRVEITRRVNFIHVNWDSRPGSPRSSTTPRRRRSIRNRSRARYTYRRRRPRCWWETAAPSTYPSPQ